MQGGLGNWSVELAEWGEQNDAGTGEPCHGTSLDTGGWSFGEAVCNFALLVKHRYGDGVGEGKGCECRPQCGEKTIVQVVDL